MMIFKNTNGGMVSDFLQYSEVFLKNEGPWYFLDFGTTKTTSNNASRFRAQTYTTLLTNIKEFRY